MIHFHNVRWQNFLSSGNNWTEIQLDRSPNTLVVGENGAGKSTMLDALCFSLFGKPFRKINIPQLINSVNQKGLMVEVNFTIGSTEYRVVRGEKPKLFEIYKDGNLINQVASRREYQVLLEQNILKLNYNSFTQIVILGSSTFVPFMQLPAHLRRDIIEDLLDIKIFSHMNTILKDRYKVAYQQSKDCSNLLSIAEEKVKSQEKLIKSLREVNSVRRYEKEDKIVQNKALIDSLISDQSQRNDELSALDQQLIDTDQHRNLLSDLKSKTSDLKSEIKRIGKDMKFLKSHDTCPTCTQDISSDFKKEKIDTLTKDGIDYTKALKKEQKAIDEISSIFKFNDAILRNLILKKENAVTSESAMLTNKENVEKSAENYY